MKPVIIEPAISQWVAEVRALVEQLREAESAAVEAEKKLVQTREAAQMRRFEIGRYLLKVREQMPRRGTKENGWKAFLEAIEVDDSTAHRYMELARTATSHGPDLRSSDGGELDDRDVPPPSDDDAPASDVQASAPDDEDDIDRDTWCTPKWITDAIGEFDLDPCANERSHVNAIDSFILENGQDGLELAAGIGKKSRVFINPPYSKVRPWIDAYAHTRFCFLLKFDTSTEWFEVLLEMCELVLHPRRTRVQFEAPPGVPKEKAIANQFPHSLFYARAADATPAIKKLCYPPWRLT